MIFHVFSESYVSKFWTVGRGKKSIHWKLLINILAKYCLLVNFAYKHLNANIALTILN